MDTMHYVHMYIIMAYRMKFGLTYIDFKSDLISQKLTYKMEFAPTHIVWCGHIYSWCEISNNSYSPAKGILK